MRFVSLKMLSKIRCTYMVEHDYREPRYSELFRYNVTMIFPTKPLLLQSYGYS